MDTLFNTTSANTPRHVGIIMDGNGRWAKQAGHPRAYGHIRGVESVRNVVASAAEFGIRFLTLYVFSNENWRRPESEVNSLMGLIAKNIKKETENFRKNNIKLLVIGDLSSLPSSVAIELKKEIEKTSLNTGLNLILAISYSGREEIIHAVKQAMMEVQDHQHSIDDLTESFIQKHLYQGDIPAPDMIIRTGGESRISNFLLWQAAHSRLLFLKKYWPEFGRDDLFEAIRWYRSNN